MQPFTKTYKKGLHLFHENDRSRELFVIQSGAVRVYRRINGKEIELASLKKGSVVGEMALIDGKPRSASAVAVEDCLVTIIEAEAFLEKVAGAPPWFLSVIKTVSEKIRNANQRLELVYDRNHAISVGLTVYYLFQRSGTASHLDCTETVGYLSKLLCLSAQRCTEALDYFQKKGFLDITNGKMRLIDAKRFLDFCFFLRANSRKLFDKLKPLSDKARQALPALRRHVALGSIYLEKNVDISSSDMDVALSGCSESNTKQSIVADLRSAEIICGVKGQSPAGAQENGAECKFCIDRAVFEKYYLHTTFAAMLES